MAYATHWFTATDYTPQAAVATVDAQISALLAAKPTIVISELVSSSAYDAEHKMFSYVVHILSDQ